MKKNILICLIIILGILFVTGCDHTDLSGEIIIPNGKIKVGDKVPLTLIVPEELSGIYRTMWDVQPNDIGKIIEGDQLLNELTEEEFQTYFGAEENIQLDRIALFIADKKGECCIDVAGFYKQTNPQYITYIEIEVE